VRYRNLARRGQISEFANERNSQQKIWGEIPDATQLQVLRPKKFA